VSGAEYRRGTKEPQEPPGSSPYQATAGGNLVYQDDAHQTYLFFSPRDAQKAMNSTLASEFKGSPAAWSGQHKVEKTFLYSNGVQEGHPGEFSTVNYWNQEISPGNTGSEALLEEIRSRLQAIEETVGRLEVMLLERHESSLERLVEFFRSLLRSVSDRLRLR
jgi:hypothetical protein